MNCLLSFQNAALYYASVHVDTSIQVRKCMCNTGTLAVHISIATDFQLMNVNFDDHF
jgi:hypothetical protein